MNVTRNRIAPWQEQGRWYHVFLESDGSSVAYTLGDIGADSSIQTVDNDYAFCLEADFIVCDYKAAVHVAETTDAEDYTPSIKMYGDGMTGIYLPNPANWDYMDLYIFGYTV